MKNLLPKTALVLLALVGSALPIRSQDEVMAHRKVESKAARDARSAKTKAAAKKAKARAKEDAEALAKAVDINSASKEQLKTLPGITDAYADKIIAGRPYLSKAFLVTKNVLPQDLYLALRKRIVARQPGMKP